MAEPVVEIRGLRKEFAGRGSSHVAVADLDLSVREGEVHGFLGPNGSGKTTTIRMLLGLAAATSGSMALFGRPVPASLPEVIGRVGAVRRDTRLRAPTRPGEAPTDRAADAVACLA